VKSLKEARAIVRYEFGGRLPRRNETLRGEMYEDGTFHVEAYYHDGYESSGYWITRTA
jgi:hypothetical protein